MKVKLFFILLLFITLCSLSYAVLLGDDTQYNPSESNVTYVINSDQSGITFSKVNATCFVIDAVEYCTQSPTDIIVNLFVPIDGSPPTITVYSPTNTTYDILNITIHFNAIDTSGVSDLWYYNTTDNISYSSIDYALLPQGEYTFTFYANDTLNNVGSIDVKFTINTSFYFGNYKICDKASVTLDDLPCVQLYELGDCNQSLDLYYGNDYSKVSYLGEYNAFYCGFVFNESVIGNYFIDYSSGDKDFIILEEVAGMNFFNLLVFIVMFGGWLIFTILMHYYKDEEGQSIIFGSIGTALMVILVGIMISGFEVITTDITFIFDINYYFIALCSGLALYTTAHSYLLWQETKQRQKYQLME